MNTQLGCISSISTLKNLDSFLLLWGMNKATDVFQAGCLSSHRVLTHYLDFFPYSTMILKQDTLQSEWFSPKYSCGTD